MSIPKSIDLALDLYLDEIGKSRAATTRRTYYYIFGKFRQTLTERDIIPEDTPTSDLSNDWAIWFLDDTRHLAETTERGYIASIIGFYEYAVAKQWVKDLNLTELRFFIRRRQRKLPDRTLQLPRQQIQDLLNYLDCAAPGPFRLKREELATLRDCALYHLLADTGLRVSELCQLKRRDLNKAERTLFVVGKGNKQVFVRVSNRTIQRTEKYLDKRRLPDLSQVFGADAPLYVDGDDTTKVELGKLPLFARHDRGVGKKILPLSPRSVQLNLKQWITALYGDNETCDLSPHTFRHYFVTKVLRATGGDVEIAKRLARHSDISTTMCYAHANDQELDNSYHSIFSDEN